MRLTKYQVMGQNNPPKGWHIFEFNDNNLNFTALCGEEFDLRGRVYPGGHLWEWDRQDAICEKCRALLPSPAPPPVEQEA